MMRKPATNRKNTAKMAGNIRIIGGKWRGRKLPVTDLLGLRPTTDRVKETVFNWLMNDVRGSICLDCFAGSGSLGFEALSRGADHVTLVEKDHTAAKQLQQNLNALSTNNACIVNNDCLQYIGQASPKNATNKPFDLVFIDPPFRLGLATKICELLNTAGILAPNALIYLEVERELESLTIPANWQLLKQKNAGQVCYSLYQLGD